MHSTPMRSESMNRKPQGSEQTGPYTSVLFPSVLSPVQCFKILHFVQNFEEANSFQSRVSRLRSWTSRSVWSAPHADAFDWCERHSKDSAGRQRTPNASRARLQPWDSQFPGLVAALPRCVSAVQWSCCNQKPGKPQRREGAQ